jgi:hypothetical protein
MRAGHRENVRGPLDQRGSKRLTPLSANVDAFLLADLDRVQTRGLTADRVDARGSYFNVLPIPEEATEKTFRHRASANISRTNEEDAFHDSEPANCRLRNLKSNRTKSTQAGTLRCGLRAFFSCNQRAAKK